MDNTQLNKHILKYAQVFTILLLLTMLTFIQPLFITFGIKGVFVSQMIIASIKAFFILSFFMHLKDSTSLTKIIVMCTAAILAVFFIIVGIDSNMDDSPRDMFQTHKITH